MEYAKLNYLVIGFFFSIKCIIEELLFAEGKVKFM